MTGGTDTTNNSDLAFVTRCSVSDLLVTSAGYDLWCTMIQWHSGFIDVIDSVGRLHQIIFYQRILKQIKVLIHRLLSQAVHSHIGRCVSFTEGELWLPLHKSPEPPIGDPLLTCHSSLITNHRFCQTHYLLPCLPIASLSNIY